MALLEDLELPLKATWKVQGNGTEVIWWPARATTEEKTVLFMIPGNPGVVEFYTPFLNTIYSELNEKIDIVGVSHLGHSKGEHDNSDGKVYSLDEQIAHKIDCLDMLHKRYPKNTRFILVGHSIGAFICEKVFKARPNLNIVRVFSLFPTIEHIADTPRGKQMRPLFRPEIRKIASALAQVLGFVHQPTLAFLIKTLTGQPKWGADLTARKFINFHAINNSLSLAAQEMNVVKDLNEAFYARNLDIFVFYYGTIDGWVPVERYLSLKDKLPEANAYLCQEKIPHEFVFEFPRVMGVKVSTWIIDLEKNM
ncbi:alpha/beta-hydrolase [Basidiobolus meristosporus CBS 931.73]|uniref:Alpha/beta-hydrolase n=1 Tax=Basidiobolus meristosporus CBS 931.73 TaxID=1314790 RepID=A0A1Y1XRP5_9FUNG|nr:alpha/beta-hydrolase [Basidiobolus meristosporus CBS 931.73]|eukprot:ORX88166.1 alpha/beta-hydrolase [Basidiobolus meristosporus CBS 931.73]